MKTIIKFFLIAIIALALTSCSKDTIDPIPEPQPEVTTLVNVASGMYVIAQQLHTQDTVHIAVYPENKSIDQLVQLTTLDDHGKTQYHMIIVKSASLIEGKYVKYQFKLTAGSIIKQLAITRVSLWFE